MRKSLFAGIHVTAILVVVLGLLLLMTKAQPQTCSPYVVYGGEKSTLETGSLSKTKKGVFYFHGNYSPAKINPKTTIYMELDKNCSKDLLDLSNVELYYLKTDKYSRKVIDGNEKIIPTYFENNLFFKPPQIYGEYLLNIPGSGLWLFGVRKNK